MGITDKLKKMAANSGLWEESEQTTPTDSPPPTKQPSKLPFTTIPVVSDPVAPSIGVVLPDEETVKLLTAATNATKNTAHAQFKAVFDALAGLPDASRYPAAMNALTASTQITATDVLAAFDERVGLLEAESKAFEAAMVDANEQTVVVPAKQIASIEQTIAAKKKEIEALETQRATLTQQVEASQAQLNQERAGFNASFSTVQNQIAAERKNFEFYIKISLS